MREALSQLAAEGWVDQRAQRGFRVPAISAEEIVDLARTRQIVEAAALALAQQHGAAAWEDEIVSSFHLYALEVERAQGGGQANSEDREARHHRFHRALIAACPLTALKDFCDELYVRMTRYRCILRIRGVPSKHLIEEHRTLMDIALSRNAVAAQVAIEGHVWLTAQVALEVLAAPTTDSATKR
jgi:DNA-binding GntR family transcriptional regulator